MTKNMGVPALPSACRNCAGEQWVCENHQDTPWEASGHSDNCGAGAPCPVCNREMACAPFIPQWRDIGSAPKDGSYIIAGRFSPDTQELKWVTHSRWITAAELADNYGEEPDDYDDGWTDGEDEDEPCVPTHWMPLEPPEQSA